MAAMVAGLFNTLAKSFENGANAAKAGLFSISLIIPWDAPSKFSVAKIASLGAPAAS